MTLVNIDLRNQGYETGSDDRVIFYSLLVREGDFGTISTAPVEVELVEGKASVDLAPGPVGVQIIAGQVADTRVREGRVPMEGPTTLNVVLTLLPEYSDAVRASFLAAIRGAQDEALTRIDAEVAVAVGAEMGDAIHTAASSASIAQQAAISADLRAASAEGKSNNAISRVSALEVIGGLAPGEPVDGQTANLIEQESTLTRLAVVQAITGTTNVWPVEVFGAVGDGVADDTQAWNDAIEHAYSQGGGTVTGAPNSVYMIKADAGGSVYNDYGGIGALSGVDICIPAGCTLRAFPVTTTVSKIIRITDKENIRVYGTGTIDGNRANAVVTTGEWGYGVAINAGRNIRVEGIRAVNCWGDGINLQKLTHTNHTAPENVVISGVICDNNRRQGLSAEAVTNLLIENSTFSNTNGTPPACGVDLEPPSANGVIRDATIRGCRFVNNQAKGLTLHEHASDKMDNITIENNVFDGNGLDGTSEQFKCTTGGKGLVFRGNTFINTRNEVDVSLRGPARGLSVRDNNFLGDVQINGSSLSSLYPSGTQIVGNHFQGGELQVAWQRGFNIAENTFDTAPGKTSLKFVISSSFEGVVKGNFFSGGLHHIDATVNPNGQLNYTKFTENTFARSADASILMLGPGNSVVGNTFNGCCDMAGESVILDVSHWDSHQRLIEGNTFRQKTGEGHKPIYAYNTLANIVSGGVRGNRLIGGLKAFPDDLYPTSGNRGGSFVLAGAGNIPTRPSSYRPPSPSVGQQFYDTTLGKLIVYNGTSWRNQDGTPLA